MPRLRSLLPTLTLVLLAAGCASSRGPDEAASPDPATRFVREVYPFPVYDEAGAPYEHPFLGGFNVPRPQFIDIDGDGDLDLFVQEVTGAVKFFENTGTPEAARYVWRTDRFHDLDVGEWYRFFDLDADGDFDLLAEERYSYVRYFRNEGTPRAPRFRLAVDSLRDADGTPLFSDRQNIPNLTDIDCDDALDLFIGKLDGTVMRYESVGMDADDVPRFRLLTERFENIEIVAQLSGSLHGANTLALTDIDGDGDQDFFWGDFFEPGLLFIRNTGTCASPSLRSEPVPFPPGHPFQTSGYNAPFFADIDADGDVDLFVGVLGGAFNPIKTSADNFYFFEQTDDGDFVERTRRYLKTIDVGSESVPAFADLDGDGDLDLFLSNKIAPDDFNAARMHRFENVGTPEAPVFRERGVMPLHAAFHYVPAFGDLDGDGDLDMLVGTWTRGKVAFYRNEGTPTAPDLRLETDEYLRLTRGSNAAPALVDIDADGDLDLFVGEFSGTVNFYRNDGTPQAPAFTLVSDEYLGIDVGQRSFPAFHDLDGDGDFDLILGTEAEGLIVYRNDGTPQAPAFVRDDAALRLAVPALATPAFVDLDGDGDADFVTGGLSGGLLYYERR
ncbi:FG-GAP repeat domain-containing protein [Rhodocaloribacter sp.]